MTHRPLARGPGIDSRVRELPPRLADAQSEQTCEAGLFVDERGMRFIGRWKFSLGTQLAVACEWNHPILGRVKVDVEGMVVWCERVARSEKPAFDTTVLFLDLPEELKEGVREFAMRVA